MYTTHDVMSHYVLMRNALFYARVIDLLWDWTEYTPSSVQQAQWTWVAMISAATSREFWFDEDTREQILQRNTATRNARLHVLYQLGLLLNSYCSTNTRNALKYYIIWYFSQPTTYSSTQPVSTLFIVYY